MRFANFGINKFISGGISNLGNDNSLILGGESTSFDTDSPNSFEVMLNNIKKGHLL